MNTSGKCRILTFLHFIAVLFVAFILSSIPSNAEIVTTTWGGNAEKVYNTGFMHNLRKHPDGGVCLFNMELIENDAPGSGYSEKGVDSDFVWGPNQARKILYLDDPRANPWVASTWTLFRSGHKSRARSV